MTHRPTDDDDDVDADYDTLKSYTPADACFGEVLFLVSVKSASRRNSFICRAHHGRCSGYRVCLLCAGSSSGVEITEVANTPEQANSPTAKAAPAPWRPPPVPQSSININKHVKAEPSSST